MKISLASTVALSLTLIAPSLPAQTTSADVQALLNDAARAYRGLTAFSATMEVTRSGESSGNKTTTKLTLQKPGKLNAEIVTGTIQKHVVADGTTIFSDSSADKTQYTKQPVTKFADLITALTRGGGGGVGLLPILLTSPNAEQLIIPGKPTSVKRLPEATVSGEACEVIEAAQGAGPTTTRYEFAFGKRDHLLRRLTIETTSQGAKSTTVETYSAVTLQPAITAATFTYAPAAGAVATDAPAQPAAFDPRLKVGAAPLAISGKDLAGQAVSLDQYEGKVLLIDFWAVWCGPCVAEMPNVVAAYNKYHAAGFEILGVSLDQANDRPKLEKFIADQKMPWRQIYDGKYWSAENAVGYGVHSIPFTVLIGRDGKIAAVSARGPALAPAIAAALAK